jgi:hypothetical protein
MASSANRWRSASIMDPGFAYVRVRFSEMIARANLMHFQNILEPMLTNERVWAPDKKWANGVISEVASAPKGKFNDLCDTVSAALIQMRDHGLCPCARSSGVTSAESSFRQQFLDSA